MKKMIAVYVFQVLLLGAVITVGVLMLREMRAMKAELVSIKNEQRATNLQGVVQVEVVNTPTVEIDEPLQVKVDEPLSVSVDNEPEVRVAP